MNTDRALSVGIIGAHPERGWALLAHIPALRSLPEYRITAVSARDQATADAAARVFGAKGAFTDIVALASSPEVDVVTICVRVPGHLEAVGAALAAGKHVYCEWPLGRDLGESLQMSDAAKRAPGRQAIGLQGRNSPAVEAARELVNDGAIGRLLSARMYSASNGWGPVVREAWAYTADKSTGATLLTITGGHSLDALCHIVGPVASVGALLATQRAEVVIEDSGRLIRPTSPDNITLFARHRNGCVSTVFVTGGRPADGRFSLHIHGTDGHLILSSDELGDFQISNLTLSGVTKQGPVTWPPASAPKSTAPSGPAANVSRIYRKLANDIRLGSSSAASFDDAIRMSELIDAIQRSSDTGQMIELPGA